MSGPLGSSLSDFARAYAQHRASEGRALGGEALAALPYVRRGGPFAKQWAVRARSFEKFISAVVMPMARMSGRRLHALDLGAGNGWLSHRLCSLGHLVTAVDIRDDDVDGLGAATSLQRKWPGRFERITASFERLPLQGRRFDLVIFNASLHYARDLSRAIGEAIRMTVPAGVIAILDSPFYRCEADGAAMVAEKLVQGSARFGGRANILLTQNFIEYLTPERLAAAAPLSWQRHRVLYPLWYELRPMIALLERSRAPSRFDVWTARVP